MNIIPDAELNRLGLEDLLAMARSRFDVVFESVAVGDTTLEILQLADMDAYVERLVAAAPAGSRVELPFWARLWPGALLLAYYIQRLQSKGRTLLEIGAGVGLCGLAAAAQGFTVTISDIHPDSLLFSRINILKNNLQDRAQVARVDFATDRLKRRFDCIAGAEVLYREEHYRPLIKFLLAHIKDAAGADVVLSREWQRKVNKFCKLAERDFVCQTQTIGLKAGAAEKSQQSDATLAPEAADADLAPDKLTPGQGDRHLLCIHRMRAKKHAA